MRYWRLVWNDATEHWRASFKAERRRVVQVVLPWAVLLCVLFFIDIPWIDAQRQSDAVKLGLLSFPILLLAWFGWSLVTAPGRMHRALSTGIEERDNILREIADTEAGLQRLAELHREGQALYNRPGLDPSQWVADLAVWDARVAEEIKNQFSVSQQFKYLSVGFGRFYDFDEVRLLSATTMGDPHEHYAARLSALQHTIADGGHRFIGPKRKDHLDPTRSSAASAVRPASHASSADR